MMKYTEAQNSDWRNSSPQALLSLTDHLGLMTESQLMSTYPTTRQFIYPRNKTLRIFYVNITDKVIHVFNLLPLKLKSHLVKSIGLEYSEVSKLLFLRMIPS